MLYRNLFQIKKKERESNTKIKWNKRLYGVRLSFNYNNNNNNNNKGYKLVAIL
jgi:hypothetical protein